MTNEEIVENIKTQYNRDLRKQLVKNIQESEKMDDQEKIKSGYNIMNQIFSYVLGQLGWSLAESSQAWDNSPLEILKDAFPHIESTQWYKGLELNVQKSIDLTTTKNAK